jgi:hypothetical protein
MPLNQKRSDNSRLHHRLATTAGVPSSTSSHQEWHFTSILSSQSLDLAPYDLAATSKYLIIDSPNKSRRIIVNSLLDNQQVDISWFKFVEKSAGSQITTNDLEKVISGLNLMMKHKQFLQIGILFRSLNLKKVAPEILIAFLRSTFSLKNQLAKVWFQFRDDVDKELRRRKLPPDIILKGLRG